MKKILLFMLLLIGVSVTLTEVTADIGPKPSLKITIKGIDEPYELDLLTTHVEYDTTDMTLDDFYDYEYAHYLQAEFKEEFIHIRCNDGLASDTLYGNPIGTLRETKSGIEREFQYNYYPPQTFKMVLLLENGTVIISDQVVRTYFDTVITWDLSGVDISTNSESTGFLEGNMGIGTPEDFEGYNRLEKDTIIRTIIRMILTASIEVCVLFLFKYRKRNSYLLVGGMNLLTQALLSYYVVTQLAYNGAWSAIFALIVGEILVFSFETVFYAILLNEKGIRRAILYGLIANTVSLVLGFFLVIYI